MSLRGINRLNPRCIQQASPINPQVLSRIHAILDHNHPAYATMFCLFLNVFYSLSRKSNLVVTGIKFDANKQLCRSDIKVGSKELLITFCWTKTIQFGQRVLKVALVAMPQSCLCPLKAYQNMLNLVSADPQAPAFSLPSKTNIKPVTYRFLQSFFKLAINSIGLNSFHFSSHSFHRGGTTWAYMRYIDFSLEQRMQVSQQMVKHILETT